MDENGGYGETAARQAGRGRGDGSRGEHGHSGERVVRKSRLGPNFLNKCAGQDTGHPQTTATPRGSKYFSFSLQNICLNLGFFRLYADLGDGLHRILPQGIWLKNH